MEQRLLSSIFEDAFNSNSFEFDSLTSCYPSNNDEFTSDIREHVAFGFVDSVVLANPCTNRKIKKCKALL